MSTVKRMPFTPDAACARERLCESEELEFPAELPM